MEQSTLRRICEVRWTVAIDNLNICLLVAVQRTKQKNLMIKKLYKIKTLQQYEFLDFLKHFFLFLLFYFKILIKF